MSLLLPNGEFSLGLSMVVKSHKPPEASPTRERSGKPQTSHAKRMVRNGVAKLERQHGKQNLAFVTYTVPDMPADDMDAFREGLPEVVRQLKQSIERDLRRAGIDPEVVYVVEIHQERYERTGQIVPHIHVVFQSRKNYWSPYAISTERNTELWNRAVSNVLKRRVEMPWGARIEQVKKSAERYMAKYMSKGGKLAKEAIKEGKEQWLPKQWWGMSRSLSRWIKANTRLLSSKDEQFIKDNYKEFKADINHSPFSWIHDHNVDTSEPGEEPRWLLVAIVGKVREKFMSMFEGRSLTDAPMSWEW